MLATINDTKMCPLFCVFHDFSQRFGLNKSNLSAYCSLEFVESLGVSIYITTYPINKSPVALNRTSEKAIGNHHFWISSDSGKGASISLLFDQRCGKAPRLAETTCLRTVSLL